MYKTKMEKNRLGYSAAGKDPGVIMQYDYCNMSLQCNCVGAEKLIYWDVLREISCERYRKLFFSLHSALLRPYLV